ncbi:hypothetical protein F4553_001107 [Allocatelliglobosispora scoriae]|uniref:Uncharacterized protein n=1 Tax=Allocatelliglobosispora scoriae TaxID=643052 RepID=A0A841BK53_9ACTN|nr:hypothetical protein [Allocatelliglobosispora scoriae]MBB5867728.1 hypothetical protein [Allocatelliglobosispora scoriae]
MSGSVIVEVVLLSEHDGTLRYRSHSDALGTGTHPDAVARHLSGLQPGMPGGLLHSTSWRYDDGGLILTYAALPDPHPELATTALPVDAMVTCEDPLVPSPAVIDLDAVAAHACRHLALLHATDPVVRAAADEARPLWDVIVKLPPGPAGGLSL